MENRFLLTLDFKLKTTRSISFVQNNVGTSVLEISVVDGGQVTDPATGLLTGGNVIDITGQTISLAFLKPDNTLVIQDETTGVAILDALVGKLECILLSNTLAATGVIKAEVSFSKDGNKLSTTQFNFTVSKSLDNGSGVLSSNQIPIIEAQIEEWQTEFDAGEVIRADMFTASEGERVAEFEVIKAQYAASIADQTSLEVVAARSGEVDLPTKITKMDTTVNQLQANLAINLKNPPIPLVGAKFDYDRDTGVGTDDTSAVQNILDFAFNNNIFSITAPNGFAKTTLPIILKTNTTSGAGWWSGKGQIITGFHKATSGIIKVGSSTLSGYHAEVDGIDSTIILFNNGALSGGQGTGVGVSQITLENTSAVATSRAITGVACERLNIEDINIVAYQGIIFSVCYSSRFKNIVMHCVENAFQITQGTSNTFEFLYAPMCQNPYKIYSAYSNMLSVSADNSTGTIFDVSGNGLTMSGCGCESPKAQYIVRAHNTGIGIGVNITNLSMFRQTGDAANGLNIASCAVFYINSAVKVGQLNILDGQEITGNSYLLYAPDTVVANALDIGQITYYKNYTGGTVNPKLLYNSVKSGSGNSAGKLDLIGSSINVRRNMFMPYLGMRNLTDSLQTGFKDKAIYLDNATTTTDLKGTNLEYEQKYNTGDVLLINDPKAMNLLGYVVTANAGSYVRDCVYAGIPIVLAGTTALRPTLNLYVGLQYFDTTLGKPIWCKYGSGTWVDATGVTV